MEMLYWHAHTHIYTHEYKHNTEKEKHIETDTT
jgi:hypothetical protein